MNPLLSSYYTFGRNALEKRFGILVKEIENVKRRNSIDSIHDVRVASRRFHAAARLFPDCISKPVLTECERAVRRIRKSSGTIRDGDVHMHIVERVIAGTPAKQYHDGMRRLIVRLKQKREKELPRLFSAVNSFEKKSIPGKMVRDFSAPLPTIGQPLTLHQRAARDIVTYLGNLLDFDRCVFQSNAATELHEMRIAAKRLRYVMEIYSPLYSNKLKPYIDAVRSIQTHLGELHDCDVWLQQLPLFIEKERKRTIRYFGDTSEFPNIEKGIVRLIEQLRTERAGHYRTFLNSWLKCQKDGMWDALSVTVTVPRSLRSRQ